MKSEATVGSVYVLIDPITEEIRYVGWTKQKLEMRFKEHLKEKKRSYKLHWINKLKNRGKIPRIQLVQQVSINQWVEAEIYWISYFKSIGCKLTNIAMGGQGCLRQYLSEEQRSAIGTATKKRWAEWRAAGRHISPETREKLRQARLGKTMSAEHKAKISLTHRGKPKSAEQRAKISAANLGKPKSLEHIANLVVARRAYLDKKTKSD